MRQTGAQKCNNPFWAKHPGSANDIIFVKYIPFVFSFCSWCWWSKRHTHIDVYEHVYGHYMCRYLHTAKYSYVYLAGLKPNMLQFFFQKQCVSAFFLNTLVLFLKTRFLSKYAFLDIFLVQFITFYLQQHIPTRPLIACLALGHP